MAKIENHTPVSIPTFYDKEMLDEVRVMTINPLAHEVTKLSNLMSSTCGSINSLDTKLVELQAKVDKELGSNGVDLGPLTNSVSKNTSEIQTLKTDSVNLKKDIDALELKVDSTDISILDVRVQKNEIDIKSHQTDIENLKRETLELSVDLDAVEIEIPPIVADVSLLKIQQTVTSSTVDNAVKTIEAFGQNIVDIEIDVRDAKETVRLNDLAVKANELEVQKVKDSLSTNATAIKTNEEAIKKTEKDILDNTALIESKDLAIKANEDAIKKSEYSIEILDMHVSDLQSLVNAGGTGGSGGGTAPDLTDIKKDIADNKTGIKNLEGLVKTNTDEIETLKNNVAPPVVVEPTKFYILPIMGQSNGVGYGELGYDLGADDAPHPRIKQLGRYGGSKGGTNSSDNLNNARTGYGDRWDELRPYSDCNLKIIPATPGLDMVQNMFQFVVGGTVSFGLYTAKMLLKHIPDDYGILIVPCARGGSAFTSGASGTYDASRLYPSESCLRHGVGQPLSTASYTRVKHALQLNPSNKLLPIIWVQGEHDQGKAPAHLSGFEDFFKWYRDSLVSDGLATRILGGTIEDLRFICMGSTKWVMGCNLQKNFIKDTISFEGTAGRMAVYDNYYYLSQKYKNSDGSSQIVYVRGDVNPDGSFVETNRERGTGATTSTREIHFSTHANRIQLPKILYNAILGHTRVFSDRDSVKVSRDIRGESGLVHTDGVEFKYNKPSVDFDLNNKLLVHQKWPTVTQTGKLTNHASGSSITLTGGASATVVADANFGGVLRLTDAANNHIEIPLDKGSTSYTKSVVFKPDPVSRNANSNLLSVGTGGAETDGIIWFVSGSLIAYPDYTSSQKASNISSNPCLYGSWDGDFNNWQHLVVTYNKTSGKFSLYLNGALLGQCKSTTATLGKISLGNYKGGALRYKGDVANYRIYDRCLSHGEIGTLWHCDMKNYL